MSIDRKERVLVKNAKKGDVDAFEQIVIMHEKMVYQVAFKMTGNKEDAKELSQEAFLKVYRSLDRFRFQSKLSTWIYRITTNVCLDMLRKKKVETYSIDEKLETDEGSMDRQIKDDNVNTENSILRKEKVEIVRKQILNLQPEHRAVLVLRDLEGMSYIEISKILKLPEGTVKSRLNRARKDLKKNIENNTELLSANYVKLNRKEGQA